MVFSVVFCLSRKKNWLFPSLKSETPRLKLATQMSISLSKRKLKLGRKVMDQSLEISSQILVQKPSLMSLTQGFQLT